MLTQSHTQFQFNFRSLYDFSRETALACANLFYPRRCLHCRSDLLYDGRSILCHTCHGRIRVRNIETKDRGQGAALSGSSLSFAKTLGDYGGPLKELIHHFKYGGSDGLALELGELLAKCWRSDPAFWDSDGIIPVPSHRARIRERGYDRIQLLAKSMLAGIRSPDSGKPVLYDRLMVRVRKSVSQTELSREDRQKNVANVFAVLQSDVIRGKKFILLDDVLTTGATVQACAAILLQAGAREVACLAIARD